MNPTVTRHYRYRQRGDSDDDIVSAEVPPGDHAPLDVAHYLVLMGGLRGRQCTCCGMMGPIEGTEWSEVVVIGNAEPIVEPWRALTRSSKSSAFKAAVH